jgi:hypothetical protein
VEAQIAIYKGEVTGTVSRKEEGEDAVPNLTVEKCPRVHIVTAHAAMVKSWRECALTTHQHMTYPRMHQNTSYYVGRRQCNHLMLDGVRRSRAGSVLYR